LISGHWPSYNVPFYEQIYNMSGYPEIVAEKGLDYSYQMAPRAKIFRRDADKVADMKSMMDIMRYNGTGIYKCSPKNYYDILGRVLYDQVKPQSILAWQRVRIAHMMSATAADWGRIFSIENSGKDLPS
jgi:hypothetical protein